MQSSHDPLCFTCKQPVGDPPVVNELAEDEVCPACAERVLEALPPALPGLGREPLPFDRERASARDEGSEYDLPGADFDPHDFPPEPA